MVDLTERARSSRLSGFFQKTVSERSAFLAQWADLQAQEVAWLQDGLSTAEADKMIENVVGRFALPLGIATNFIVNGREYLVPMVVEEPSVIAAVSYTARLTRMSGGFWTGSTDPVMIGQIQLLDVPDPAQATEAILGEKAALLSLANTSPTIARLGGGPVDIEVRQLDGTGVDAMTVVHLLFDTRDAMGANAVNTAAERIAPALERLSGGRALLRILSNLSDRRRAWAAVALPTSSFSSEDFAGEDVIQGIAAANTFALADPYRAATHNKGILNGIDAVAIATGNDWRAIEAGAHAYAARSGAYRALTEWRVVAEAGEWPETAPSLPGGTAFTDLPLPALYGRIELPLAVGIVGGATQTHPTARVALKILDVQSARQLSEVMAAVGLAQNLAAIRALVTDGIQRGHMRLHARQVAMAAGARDMQIDRVAVQLVQEGQIRVERARELLTAPEMWATLGSDR
jgi:hydroxymethylglutaryl-CoA reductase